MHTIPLECIKEATFSEGGAAFVLDMHDDEAEGLVDALRLPGPAPWWSFVYRLCQNDGEVKMETAFRQSGDQKELVSEWLRRLQGLPWAQTRFTRRSKYDHYGRPSLIVDENLLEEQ